MNPPLGHQRRQRRDSVRQQARLDAETSAKLEELVSVLHRKRAQIVRYVMRWGLAHTEGWTVDPSIPDRPHLVHMLVEPELLQQVQEAAAAHGTSVAAWLRYALRQVTRDDFPASWQAKAAHGGQPRSHDSRLYGQRFMLRLDEITSRKLQHLVKQSEMPRAEFIRQLIAGATPEDFPESWPLRVEERRRQEARPAHHSNH
jgi:predicted transcriptional regulator